MGPTSKLAYDGYFGLYPASDLCPISSTAITVPLGQLAIATAVHEAFPEARVRVYYGEQTPENEILVDLQGQAGGCRNPLVGITLNAGNLQSALRWAERLGSMGMDVILGGPEAWLSFAVHGAALLRAAPFSLGMAVGPGERVVLDLLRGSPSAAIENFIYRRSKGGAPCVGPIRKTSLDFGSIAVDYGLLYRIERMCGVSYLWRTDCNLARGQRCYFCGRIELGAGVRKAESVWRELKGAKERWGIGTFYNAADSVAVNLADLQRFAAASPPELETATHRCFINASQVTPTAIECLKQLNATAAVGVESCALYPAVGKGSSSVQDNLNAVQSLSSAGIPMALSFVLGLPGESASTLKTTGQFILDLARKYPAIRTFEISPLTVTVGSAAYRAVQEREKAYFERNEVPYDITELSEMFFHDCCKVTRSEVLDFMAGLACELRKVNPSVIIDVKGLGRKEGQVFFGADCGVPRLAAAGQEGKNDGS